MSKSKLPTEISHEIAMDILRKTLQILESPEMSLRFEKFGWKERTDIMPIQQYVFPEVMLIQMDVIKQFGFPGNGLGIRKFGELIKELEKKDPEVKKMHGLVLAYYYPTVNDKNGDEEDNTISESETS